jgi:hypothetical protein
MTHDAQGAEAVRQLSDRLAVEYAGAVPPGRVLACVLRIQRRLRPLHLEPGQHLAILERTVRERLTFYAARPAGVAS